MAACSDRSAPVPVNPVPSLYPHPTGGRLPPVVYQDLPLASGTPRESAPDPAVHQDHSLVSGTPRESARGLVVHQDNYSVSGTPRESAPGPGPRIEVKQNRRNEKKTLLYGSSRQWSQYGVASRGRSDYRTDAPRRGSFRSGGGGEGSPASYTASECSYESDGSSGSDVSDGSSGSDASEGSSGSDAASESGDS